MNSLNLVSTFWYGNDTTHFGVLPASSRTSAGTYNVPGRDAYFWTTDTASTTDGVYRYFTNGSTTPLWASYSKLSALSVRCLLN